jgi:tryptophanyl-tRNA synthetase
MEGERLLSVSVSTLIPRGQSRLAATRTANESEVTEPLLNAGLFIYPVLQAADILAYK